MSGALRQAYPQASTTTWGDVISQLEAAGEFDAIIMRAENNAGFARVRMIRKAHRDVGIIALGNRDQSSTAYMAGANEYAHYDDTQKVVQAIQQVLAYRGQR